MNRIITTTLLAAFFAVGFISAETKEEALVLEAIKIVEQSEVRFPATMRALGIKEGKVSLVLTVDEAGVLQDSFILESTRQAFAKSALKSIESWTFAPATCDGQAIPSTIRVDLNFKLDEKLAWQTFTAPVETNITLAQKEDEPITAFAFGELDSIPLPVEMSEPTDAVEGTATIEFYIDELGNVRCPHITGGTSLPLAKLMLETVSTWKFQPPLAHGTRTNTMLRQTFSFEDGKLTAADMK